MGLGEANNFLHELPWLIIAVGGNVSVTLCICTCVWYDKHSLLLPPAFLQQPPHPPPPLTSTNLRASGGLSSEISRCKVDSHTVYKWLHQVSPPALSCSWKEEGDLINLVASSEDIIPVRLAEEKGCGSLLTLLFGPFNHRNESRHKICFADFSRSPTERRCGHCGGRI